MNSNTEQSKTGDNAESSSSIMVDIPDRLDSLALDKEELQREFLDNLFYVQGKFPASGFSDQRSTNWAIQK